MWLHELEEAIIPPGQGGQRSSTEQSRLDLGPRDGYKWGGGFSPHFLVSVLKTQGEKDVRRQV